MSQPKTIHDAYIIYKSDPVTYNRVNITTDEGCIIFSNCVKGERLGDNEIAIYCVVINQGLRRKGLFDKLLQRIKTDNYKKIMILDAYSKEMIAFLNKMELKGMVFKKHCSDYTWSA